jgi:drug/metabolite transporter (DMT)-like permease
MALAAAALALPFAHARAEGVVLATASGALASGLGYTLWYAALPALGATRAGILQLCVPVLTAAAGVVLLDEQVTARLVASGCAILSGVALGVLRARRPASGAE